MTRQLEVGLERAVPATLAREVLSKLRYVAEGVSGATLGQDGRSIQLEFETDIASRTESIAAAVREVVAKVAGSQRLAAPPKVVASSEGRWPRTRVDPHPVLLERHELFRYGPGRYGYGPLLVDLMARLERLCGGYGRTIDARPQQFPSLIGADTLTACSYVKSFPHSLNLVLHLRTELESIKRFASTASFDGDRLLVDRECLAQPETLLSPSVCFHCYRWLADSHCTEGRAFLATGKCFRYESGNMTGLERLWDFTMHETIFVGSKEFVLAHRAACLEFARTLGDALELDYRIETATDPFFIEDFATQASFQSAFDLKYEFVATLPYREGTFAVGSVNYHQNFFGRAFRISDADRAPAHTACLGFGLDRLALAVLAQHGCDVATWPRALREA